MWSWAPLFNLGSTEALKGVTCTSTFLLPVPRLWVSVSRNNAALRSTEPGTARVPVVALHPFSFAERTPPPG